MAPTRNDEKQETVAIILADPFDAGLNFGPLIQPSDDQDGQEETRQSDAAPPFCLLQLAGTPLLAYVLDAVLDANFDKAYIYARHATVEPIRAFLNRSFPSLAAISNTQVIVKPTAATSEGDVMREVDTLQLKTNFVLLRAGYIGNLDLADLLAKFTEKLQKDANLCMDCVVAKSSHGSQQTTHVLTPNSRLVHFERNSRSKRRKCRIPSEVTEEKDIDSATLSIRSDLESVGIDICSAEVPPLFTENFDYQTTRPHFINGILTSDLLGKTISCSVINQVKTENMRAPYWATFVESTRAFSAATHAIFNRSCYPITPDEHIPGSSSRYSPRRDSLYLGKTVDLARSAAVKSSLIGSNSTVGSSTRVTASTIGRRCAIGERCELQNVHMGNNVIIGNDVVLRDAIIGTDVRIGNSSYVTNGSLVGGSVVIGARSVIERGSLGLESGECLLEPIRVTLGTDSNAIAWTRNTEDEDEDTSLDTQSREIATIGASLRTLRLHSPASSVSSLSRGSSSASLHQDAANSIDTNGALPPSSSNAIAKETKLYLDRAFQENHTVDNLVIELKTMRMASNSSISDIRDIFVRYLCSQTNLDNNEPIRARYTKVQEQMQRWGGVLTTLAPLSEQDQIDAVLSLQSWTSEDEESRGKSFILWLRAYYEQDVVSEEAVFEWWKSPESRPADDDDAMKVRQSAMMFVQQLAEADSESESESDE